MLSILIQFEMENSFTETGLCMGSKVEIFLEHSEVAFLSPSNFCENLNFSAVHL